MSSSDDIVERLRSRRILEHRDSLSLEAADEIERFRAASEDLDMACSLRDAEIERLRAAGTALLNAKTADDVVAAEAEWHRLMGWTDEQQ